jgi:hypothetical protein
MVYFSQDTVVTKAPLFSFDFSLQAAEKNWDILQSFELDLHQALQAQIDSPLKFGSEFKDPKLLSTILGEHPLWPSTYENLTNGAIYPLNEITDEHRSEDMNFFLSCGNHKSALNNRDKVKDLLTDDVIRGFSLILPIKAAQHIKGISISPLGCQEQDTINDRGEVVKKNRLTHDQSFTGPSGTSPNLRVQTEKLPKCKYGHCLKRIINYIISIRIRHPLTPIFLSKFDFDAAYRHCHLSPKTALESCCIFDSFLLVALRLTFGGAPCPNLWETCGQPTCDLANELIQNSQWDHSTFFDPLSLQILVPKRLPPNTPFTPALQLAVNIPVNDKGKGDIYIDDTIFVVPDLNDNLERVAKAAPLAINTIARPVSIYKPIPRKSLISSKKFLAEASFEESKTVLGWIINTRSLTIHLPRNKFLAWSSSIDKIISNQTTSSKELHSIEGRLNHTAYILSPMRHFLSQIRSLRFS